MRPWHKWGLGALSLIVVERALHAVLASVDVVHVLLSPGAHSGLSALLLAVLFLLLRVVVWVGLPALLLGAAGAALWGAGFRAIRAGLASRGGGADYASRAGDAAGPEEPCPSEKI